MRIGKLTVLKGHRATRPERVDRGYDVPVQDRSRVGIHVRRSSRPPDLMRAEPAVRLVRFLEAAGKPLGLHYSPDAWRARVRDLLRDSRGRK